MALTNLALVLLIIVMSNTGKILLLTIFIPDIMLRRIMYCINLPSFLPSNELREKESSFSNDRLHAVNTNL